jgi:hypothetical protein
VQNNVTGQVRPTNPTSNQWELKKRAIEIRMGTAFSTVMRN